MLCFFGRAIEDAMPDSTDDIEENASEAVDEVNKSNGVKACSYLLFVNILNV